MGVFKAILGGGAVATAIGFAANAGMTYSTYSTDRARGINPMGAGVHAIADTMLWNAFAAPMIAAQAFPLLPVANQMIKDHMGAMQRNLMPMTPFNRYQEDSQTQTTRGRAVSAIQNSRLQARGFVGQEAGLFAARYR